jgi:hypothetical protein
VELFLMDLAREYQLDTALPLAQQAVRTAGQAVDGLGRIVPAVERAVSTLEQTLPLGERAVTSAGRAADALDHTIQAVERSLAFVSVALLAAEREAVLKALSPELTRTLAFLQEERLATLKQLTVERMAAVQSWVARGPGTALLTQDIHGLVVQAVDRAFLRAAQLCCGADRRSVRLLCC